MTPEETELSFIGYVSSQLASHGITATSELTEEKFHALWAAVSTGWPEHQKHKSQFSGIVTLKDHDSE